MPQRVESEKTLERLLRNSVKEQLGGLCLKLLSTHLSGLPDRICLIPKGKIVFVEIKTTKKKPTRIQLYMHRVIRELGFRVEVVETTEQIIKLIREYKNG